jgi:transaldolase
MFKLFSDGADFEGIVRAADNPEIVGFTTNPTLMLQAKITDYEDFARATLQYLSTNRPGTSLSLEVFADDLPSMTKQALKIDEWSKQYEYDVYIKIPVTTTTGISTAPTYKMLSDSGVKCNVTAIFTQQQIMEVVDNLNHFVPSIVSIFAGRIADAGVDPEETIKFASEYYARYKNPNTKLEFLWASCREPFNYIQAKRSSCDIITMPPAMIDKMQTFGKNLNQYSLETVQMFYNDAAKSGFKINC